MGPGTQPYLEFRTKRVGCHYNQIENANLIASYPVLIHKKKVRLTNTECPIMIELIFIDSQASICQ